MHGTRLLAAREHVQSLLRRKDLDPDPRLGAGQAADRIAFFKIENDGFHLSAQRRPIEKNDLPEVAALLKQWLADCRVRMENGESNNPQSTIQNPKCPVVPKAKIVANKDYKLSRESYREDGARIHAFPLLRSSRFARSIHQNRADCPDRPTCSFRSCQCLTMLKTEFASRPRDQKIAEVDARSTCFAKGDVLVAKVTPCFVNGKAGAACSLINGVRIG